MILINYAEIKCHDIKIFKKVLVKLQTTLGGISTTMQQLLFCDCVFTVILYRGEKKRKKMKLLMLDKLHIVENSAVLSQVLSRHTQSSQQRPLTSLMFTFHEDFSHLPILNLSSRPSHWTETLCITVIAPCD